MVEEARRPGDRALGPNSFPLCGLSCALAKLFVNSLRRTMMREEYGSYRLKYLKRVGCMAE